jgi:hypothetical protein
MLPCGGVSGGVNIDVESSCLFGGAWLTSCAELGLSGKFRKLIMATRGVPTGVTGLLPPNPRELILSTRGVPTGVTGLLPPYPRELIGVH